MRQGCPGSTATLTLGVAEVCVSWEPKAQGKQRLQEAAPWECRLSWGSPCPCLQTPTYLWLRPASQTLTSSVLSSLLC